jgi:hypothetical protein
MFVFFWGHVKLKVLDVGHAKALQQQGNEKKGTDL